MKLGWDCFGYIFTQNLCLLTEWADLKWKLDGGKGESPKWREENGQGAVGFSFEQACCHGKYASPMERVVPELK